MRLLLIILLLVAGLVLYLKPSYRDRLQDLSSDIGLSQMARRQRQLADNRPAPAAGGRL